MESGCLYQRRKKNVPEYIVALICGIRYCPRNRNYLKLMSADQSVPSQTLWNIIMQKESYQKTTKSNLGYIGKRKQMKTVHYVGTKMDL